MDRTFDLLFQALKWVFVKNSEKRVAPLQLSQFDWMKVLHKYRFVHIPTPMERLLFKFTLISRMVLKVGKNSEIRENLNILIPVFTKAG